MKITMAPLSCYQDKFPYHFSQNKQVTLHKDRCTTGNNAIDQNLRWPTLEEVNEPFQIYDLCFELLNQLLFHFCRVNDLSDCPINNLSEFVRAKTTSQGKLYKDTKYNKAWTFICFEHEYKVYVYYYWFIIVSLLSLQTITCTLNNSDLPHSIKFIKVRNVQFIRKLINNHFLFLHHFTRR